jgi:hypothetical protein
LDESGAFLGKRARLVEAVSPDAAKDAGVRPKPT